jgi:hypothetical protein
MGSTLDENPNLEFSTSIETWSKMLKKLFKLVLEEKEFIFSQKSGVNFIQGCLLSLNL